ncbi:MAG: hypothetical protein ACLFM0_00525 [Spirochaetales bacterium]
MNRMSPSDELQDRTWTPYDLETWLEASHRHFTGGVATRTITA